MTPSRRRLLAIEIPFGALGLAVVVLARVFASIGIPSWIPQAPLVRLGVASPLSGMTRSFVAMASGNVVRAFEWHPLGPLVFAACLAMAALAAASWIRGGRFALAARLARCAPLWWCTAAAVAMVWVRQIVVLG